MARPWYTVVYPREDLRENKPLDASEFAVHLDQVRTGRAPADYVEPKRFFERTYLTQTLLGLAAETVRRLSGERTETSAVFNLATQFGGGKTHALTMLYHLGRLGSAADGLRGVSQVLQRAGVASVPQARVAAFVGTEFDAITGRGGHDGTPLRKTPWGEIAWQLGGEKAFAAVAEHEAQYMEPKGDVIREFLPKDKPCLILMDEVINYVSTYRRMGYGDRLYNFIQALSETARGMDNVVLVVSIPKSEYEYTAEDEADEQRFKKMLDRLGKAVMLSAETETSQIIRRRLFEWSGLPEEAKKTIREYADWAVENRALLPAWFPVDDAFAAFEATYPFHPIAVSVFERKWQALPRFQRTRGVLRLLALWVARAYHEGYKGAHKDALIDLGTAPLDDPLFRAAVFEQLGEDRLEAAVTTDICGKADSHAVRLDAAAPDAIRKARLHRKVATAIFFESNGGALQGYASLPEVRLATGEPNGDIANVETVLEALAPPDGLCYYLDSARNRFWFSVKPNLNKLLSDRRASIAPTKIDERIRAEAQKVFADGRGVDRVYFPERSNQIPDRAALTLVVLPPERSLGDARTLDFVATATKEAGLSARTFKSALIWAGTDTDTALREDARKLLAWEEISDEQDDLHLDDTQRSQLQTNLKKAAGALRESVWRSYRKLALLGKDNTMVEIDLGLITSSQADNLANLIVLRLKQDGNIEEAISPNFLVRHWPPAFTEWSTKAVRDAFFASPQFPRLLSADAVKDTISKGVTNGILGYVGKTASGSYDPFFYGAPLSITDVEISDEIYIVTKDTAEAYKAAQAAKAAAAHPPPGSTVDLVSPVPPSAGAVSTPVPAGGEPTPAATPATDTPPTPVTGKLTHLKWTGEVPSQKWTNFYTKVLSRFAIGKGLKLTVSAEVTDAAGISKQKVDEMKVSLRELGLEDNVSVD
jgi:hypothetical protein